MILLVEHKYEEKNKQVYNSQKHVIYKCIVWLEYNRGSIWTIVTLGWMWNGSICFFIQMHLEPFRFHSLKLIKGKQQYEIYHNMLSFTVHIV